MSEHMTVAELIDVAESLTGEFPKAMTSICRARKELLRAAATIEALERTLDGVSVLARSRSAEIASLRRQAEQPPSSPCPDCSAFREIVNLSLRTRDLGLMDHTREQAERDLTSALSAVMRNKALHPAEARSGIEPDLADRETLDGTPPSSPDTDYIRSVAGDCRERRADQDEAANVLATVADDLDKLRSRVIELETRPPSSPDTDAARDVANNTVGIRCTAPR